MGQIDDRGLIAAVPESPPAEGCGRCGREVGPGDGYRLAERPGGRRAVFCRLEHVVPWAMKGARWEAGSDRSGEQGEPTGRCARCEAPLGDSFLLLVRHRAEHRIPDGFCSLEHLAEWAKAGGRWR